MGCLRDNAADFVKDIAVTEANYISTWNAIKERFSNLRLQVYSLTLSLIKTSFMRKESALVLRTMVDDVTHRVRMLKNLDRPVDAWDDLLIVIANERLDPITRKVWETYLSTRGMHIDNAIVVNDSRKKPPTFKELVEFLESTIQALLSVETESTSQKSANQSKQAGYNKPKGLIKSHFSATKSKIKGQYTKSINTDSLKCLLMVRNDIAKLNGYGFALIVWVANTLEFVTLSERVRNDKPLITPCFLEKICAHKVNVQNEQCYLLLPTVEVILVSLSGQPTRAGTLLDQGSETTFISESLVQSLRLIRQRVYVPIVGIGSSKGTIPRYCVSVRLKSEFEKDFEIDVDALVLNRPTGCLPTRALSDLDLTLFSTFLWADSRFYLPGEIDMILGVDIYAVAIKHGLQNVGRNGLIAQKTTFDWIFSGQIRPCNGALSESVFEVPRVVMHNSEKENLSEVLKRFWSIEEVPGRYTVNLPLKTEPLSVFKKYHKFMHEYERLGHMRLIPENVLASQRVWYLPHHAVVQPGLTKSKLRVVFDASRRTAEQHCLNNFLLACPSLQQDLPLILLNWRQYGFVFTADIIKMFRQINIANRDQDLQRIIWSPTLDDAPRHYRLTKVTYGTTSAPYLAIRTLIQLASDEGHRYPLGAHCLMNQMYVDDVFSGANNLNEVKKIRDQLIGILQSAGIELAITFDAYMTQDLWIMKIDWDVALSSDLLKRWTAYCNNFVRITEISVSRWLGPIPTAKLELRGFADASMRADNVNGEVWVKLLITKSKIAPVKTVSIPKLELCGAVLLVKLLKYIRKLNLFKDLSITAWSDSRDALAWIHLATRRIDVDMLKNSDLWWFGPIWLGASEKHWPGQPINTQPYEQGVSVFTANQFVEENPLQCVCDLSKIISVQRRNKTKIDELVSLNANQPLTKRSCLYNLRPFLDDQGIIRAEGRLTHSALTFPAKHLPILPKTSSLSQLYIHYGHKLALHAGPTLTLGVLMHHMWITGANGLVKRLVRTCIHCFRTRPRQGTQRMDDLPPSRVIPSRPFTTTGLDYAGPFKLKCSKGRGQRTFKGYIALFVCFATKDIHLEAIGDLTTQSFLSTLRRFISRRRICHRIVSDNGTNFQGADRELRDLFKATFEFYTAIAIDLVDQGITWEFIPPSSPHFGDLWEAGVKATKHHLVRIFGEHNLTFEEFATFLAEKESCLNSRPLCPLSGDIEVLRVLTPSHFLLGGPSGLIHDLPIHEITENRFQLFTKLQQDFWKRWSLGVPPHHLQELVKWRDTTENYAVGQLVVVQDDRYPPTKWPLGRIIETHQSKDRLVRVVTVKTASTTLKRPTKAGGVFKFESPATIQSTLRLEAKPTL
ncbi:uncharacterized protein [Prorops nasuta]|uniref:uncharacterized protein n=1 Tax=Prorops nasuta TaxID=863751 RepID=UPI0034CD07A2